MAHPFIPAEDVAKVEMIYSWYSQTIENVFHCHNKDGAFGTTEMSLLAGYFKSWFDSNKKASTASTCSLQLIRVTDLTTETSPGIEYTTGLPIAGTSADPGAPSNVTLAVKWTTGLRGRSYRGRTYIPGMTASVFTGNTISGGNATALTTIYAGLITNMLAPWELVVVSLMHDGAWRSVATVTPISGASVDIYADSQRRRLTGRGR